MRLSATKDFAVVAAQCCPPPVTVYVVGYGESAASRTLSAEHGAFIEFILTWNDWRPRSTPEVKAVRTSSQALVRQCAAWFDAAKTLHVRAAAGTLLGRHLRLCPRAPALAHVPEKRHIHRRLTHLQLASYTHTTSRSRLLSGAHAPTTHERRAPSTSFSERGLFIDLSDSEWKRLKRVGRRSEWLSDSLDLRTSHAGNPRAHPRAYRRRTVGARCYTINPSVHGHCAPSFSFELFCGDGGVDLRADDKHTSPPRAPSLPSFPPFAPHARERSLDAYFPTPSTISRAPSCSAPSARVRLTLKTATRVLSLGGMDKVGNGKAREPLPPVPHARALPLGRTFSRVCALGTRPVTRHAVQRALSPLETPTRTYSRPPPPSHARASLVYPGLIPPCLCFRGAGV
ncbi:hypothetical protein C8F04DRAFT_1405337 [Mycena alexandri]|uniref:Uncharacterized protein n=1 Tax=Mycena alexandri TaxID=1745969 RepID=A0AAD6WME5_9AGAR|nr:hypothetical protein C8F04DRAFT_1405337 [Mycena alexandri]